MLVSSVKLPEKVIVFAAVVSLIVSVVACTVELKVTPLVLLVITNAPGVVPPKVEIVANPPALVSVKPPDISAIVPMLMVAPAVEPEFKVNPKVAAVTFPTVIVAAALLPVDKMVAAASVTVPKFIAVFVVLIVP